MRQWIWSHNHPYNYSPFQLRKPNTCKKEIMRVNMVYIWLMDSTTMSNLGSTTKGRCEFVFLIWSASSLDLLNLGKCSSSDSLNSTLSCFIFSRVLSLLVEKVSQSKEMAPLPTILEFLFYLWSEVCYCQMIQGLSFFTDYMFLNFYYLFLKHSTNIRRYFSTLHKNFIAGYLEEE